MTLAEYIRSGELDGFAPGAPSPEVEAIDRPVAEAAVCGVCGGVCRYRPFVSRHPFRYLAFAVCGACGAVESF